jgi:hypothetical protein
VKEFENLVRLLLDQLLIERQLGSLMLNLTRLHIHFRSQPCDPESHYFPAKFKQPLIGAGKTSLTRQCDRSQRRLRSYGGSLLERWQFIHIATAKCYNSQRVILPFAIRLIRDEMIVGHL